MLRRLKLLRVAAKLKRSRCVDVFVLFVIAGWFFIWFNANFQKLQTSFKIIIFHIVLNFVHKFGVDLSIVIVVFDAFTGCVHVFMVFANI